jgi:hypothetical protein
VSVTRHRNLFKIWTFSGAYGGGATPDPIPNSVVKTSSVDGTAWVTMWESRTVPDFLKGPAVIAAGPFPFFLFWLAPRARAGGH